MEVNCDRLLKSLIKIRPTKEFEKYLNLDNLENDDVENIITLLSRRIIDPQYTEHIVKNFPDLLLLFVTKLISSDDDKPSFYEKKCVALSQIFKQCPDAIKYTVDFFTTNGAPFKKQATLEYSPKQKQPKLQSSNAVSDLQLLRCCCDLLNADLNLFKTIWSWSDFVDNYCSGKKRDDEQFYCNKILAQLTNMTSAQLTALNSSISPDLIVSTENEHVNPLGNLQQVPENSSSKIIKWDVKNDLLTNVEGVFLPIFDTKNYNFYNECDGSFEKIVKVDTTRINLRSVALGCASGKAICLSGPVGCGKTTLIEYLARKTGHIAPKTQELQKANEEKTLKLSTKINGKGKKKRKQVEQETEDFLMLQLENVSSKNGFLRIQLGDQTDSKMLLGQYRCTDVPGEFVWQAGVLTQAVLNGYWLLLEDLDSAPQDVCTVLTNLLENNYLSVPGFRDCLKIEPGFQLFVTLRTNKSHTTSQNSLHSLLEKYLYTINVLPLSRTELCEIICENYPKLTSVANRIVDVFLTFSSGGHSIEAIDERLEEVDLLQISRTEKKFDPTRNVINILPHDKISLASIPNSGRLVSTRDLLKLCRRSDPSFSVTSTECAFFVFQNAVDLFCSHLPQGQVKTKLITNIGAKLGILPSRCEFLADEYKAEVKCDNEDEIVIGRVALNRHRLTETNENDESGRKRMKVDAALVRRKMPTFSFTRIASCLLERIAVGVHQAEPILLVGETGVGKTSAIQYLAYQTAHKLVVVNMNNQSDVSDLIGGFKPVDLGYVITPLRAEFEALFNNTFNAAKNEKFLNNISVCFNRGDYSILIKLMLRIVDTVFQKKQEDQKDSLEKWQRLQIKLNKLNSQLKNSINISFAFIPGSLVNCIRNGDWVLLDEINLASTETLECLSTILEPDGSIVLLEKGDFAPVKRHPDFRIFSCMNPSTDVGKKDLPVGIRNRFTEFFVDELTSEKDLLILVGDYLNSTGIQKTKILNSVKLYKKLRSMAQLELNDGLGNRPVYSLRTLCRALQICAKNLCGSIERNLYESFCLSFLTQLDPMSHEIVISLIQRYLLTDVRAVLGQPIPKPAGEQINFEGYWIEQGPKPVQECENYILTDSVKTNLKNLSRIISIGKLPILLQGPTSAGKTSLIEYIGKKSGNYCLRINNHEHTDLQEYIGTYMADSTGKLTFKEGVLVQAMRNGYWIILDELNLAPSDILEALNRVLDDNRELFIPETQVVVRAHPNFMLFATQNPPGLYGGRKTLSRAFKNRFIELHFSEIPRLELEIILERRCLIPKSYSQKMVKTMCELQVNRRSTAKNNFTLRDLFRWGNRYTFADKTLLEDNLYDWNQHLIDEGYLVLSAKLRHDFENEAVESTLYANFKRKTSPENLFSLHENTSMVTKQILEQLMSFGEGKNIVWTFNMRRMAVLTAKSLMFNEPVLLIGPTGCGKTTICQFLATQASRNLRILNCHMHTEGADFLGGLRPYRESSDNSECVATKKGKEKQLFVWSDGPLVISMAEGGYFLVDEISLAEDSVLERLNSVLEPERTILLAEKGGVSSDLIVDGNQASEFVIKATDGFQFLATMNPGGDFGKKELSPALRNRFTEVWCCASDSEEDLICIVENSLKLGYKIDGKGDVALRNIAQIIIQVVRILKTQVEKLNFSIRDLLAWVEYITKNTKYEQQQIQTHTLSLIDALCHGLETLFLDSLEMLHENDTEIEKIRQTTFYELETSIKAKLQSTFAFEMFQQSKQGELDDGSEGRFGISPFYVDTAVRNERSVNKDFMFSAPTTKKNLFRLLSAMTLKKAILLEGPPGVGKTSLVENLARAIGYNMVRINLCEHTDLADLFGTDLPAENSALETTTVDGKPDKVKLGAFEWRDGPLLAALKAKNTWILLDELNLAPQSVLEGLNAILDHRGEVFIPELNKTFKLGQQTRIFAAQNPLKQGGGRKGLPQSFLNRFTKVYLKKLETQDLLHVVQGKYHEVFQQIGTLFLKQFPATQPEVVSIFKFMQTRNFQTVPVLAFDFEDRLVSFSEKLETGITNFEFGYKGGPFEANLRDILRWCDLICHPDTGFNVENFREACSPQKAFMEFLLVVFEKMKLVYVERMRTDVDRAYILDQFSEIFSCNALFLEEKSENISFYFNDNEIFVGDVVITNNSQNGEGQDTNLSMKLRTQNTAPLILSNQLNVLKHLTECVKLEKPVILCGPSDSGKTKIIDLLCTLSNQLCNIDTIDDSVTGSFQQFDFNRHLEEVSQSVETILYRTMQNLILDKSNQDKNRKQLVNVMSAWENYNEITDQKTTFTAQNALSDELMMFNKRVNTLGYVITELDKIKCSASATALKVLTNKLETLSDILRKSQTLNTGGHFEWVDSKIVKSLKIGQYICLEHVNLCSSAILDRLNPIFEPGGQLLMSEKGVNADNEPDIVSKHENFRAFLTLDPKNGEISRAMRNRCIELSLNRESYSRDDLKKIIFEQGIEKMSMVKAVLQIHEQLQGVSEFNVFGVSHLQKFAFLFTQNRKMGVKENTALHLCALEVYVRSANVDLMGFGLPYYRNKLKETILDVIQNLKIDHAADELVVYNNVILRSTHLTSLSAIKLQCEPFLVMARAGAAEKANLKALLMNLSENYATLDDNIEANETIEYLLYFIYEISSFDDAKLRNIYLHECIQHLSQDPNAVKHLSNLNDKLYTEIKNLSGTVTSKSARALPWNSKLLPRIRHYQTEKLTADDQNRLSALLLLTFSLSAITTKNTIKLSQIDAITYSQAIVKKSLTDSLNNDLITNLYTLLSESKKYLHGSLLNVKLSGGQDYVKILLAFTWFNRLNCLACDEKLFLNKQRNDKLLDNLMLHFKWLDKHCVKLVNEMLVQKSADTPFVKALLKIRNFVLSKNHSLNLMKKLHAKDFSNFLPFYEQAQIDDFKMRREFEALMRVLPKMGGQVDMEAVVAKFSLLTSVKFNDCKRGWINQQSGLLLQEYFTSENTLLEAEADVKEFVENYTQLAAVESENYVRLDLKELRASMSDSIADKFSVEVLPVMEYFMLRSLNLFNQPETLTSEHLNLDYFMDTPTANLELLQLVKNTKNAGFCATFDSWNKVYHNIQGDQGKFAAVHQAIPNSIYKSYSTYLRIFDTRLKKFQLNSLTLNNAFCYNLENEANYLAQMEMVSKNQVFVNGPALVNCVLPVVMKYGGIRAAGLGELPQFLKMLKKVQTTLWNNVDSVNNDLDFGHTNLTASITKAEKLLLEVDAVKQKCNTMENENFSDFNEEFMKLIDMLRQYKDHAVSSKLYDDGDISQAWYLSSMTNSLLGAIEINVLTYIPLLDPVEKNHLKKSYVEQDVAHLKNLTLSYDMMAAIMNYKYLGEETLEVFREKLADLETKRTKYSRKAATRPDTCLYTSLAKDINHFLLSCCHPRAINSLLSAIRDSTDFVIDTQNLSDNKKATADHLQKLDELLKRIELSVNNAEQFQNHTLAKYAGYYEDFLGPLEYGITMLKYGLTGLKFHLARSRNSIQTKSSNGAFYDINEDEALSTIMENLIEFPSIHGVDLLDAEENDKNAVNIFSVLENVDNNESTYFSLLKAKLSEIQNDVIICGNLDSKHFPAFDKLFKICNQFWQKQENVRWKKLKEEESLYITKTKCAEEDEEVLAAREIDSMFPTYADDDFGDILQNDTLEQLIKVDKSAKLKKINDIVVDADYQLLCGTFIGLMRKYSRSNYYHPSLTANTQSPTLDYVTAYEIRANVFSKLFEKYKTCIYNGMDYNIYGELSFLIGFCQNNYDAMQLKEKDPKTYNFYKDSNISEVLQCVELLQKVKQRVLIELQEWPEHAILNDILLVVDRINNLQSTAPIVRFNTGLQILRQKIDEWNSVAHRLNNLRDLEADIVVYVHRWMKMELQYWRECLSQTLENVRSRAYRYWFFVYNLLNEYLVGTPFSKKTNNQKINNLIDYDRVEKTFGDEEILDDERDAGLGEEKKVELVDIVTVLKRFMESSNFAEFTIRLQLIKAFEQYLYLMPAEDEKKKQQLINVLFNIHMFFEQFSQDIETSIKSVRTPIEKELKDFVKIESFNKDLSYFSMKNNIMKVHRQIHKFLKQFETALKTRVVAVFVQKDLGGELKTAGGDEKGKNLRYEAKVKYYMVDVKNFIVSPKLGEKSPQVIVDEAAPNKLLQRIDKLFTVSRTIVKETIENMPYSDLISHLDTMMHEQIENCDHLRSLEVNREQPRPKQIRQAKQFLNQKRKALSDFYKTLQTIGLSFKSGLLQHSITEEHIDLKVPPLAIKYLTTVLKHKKNDQHLVFLNDKLDMYYSKCLFKLKLLTKVLLSPNVELGFGNLERIKGFAIDFFRLVQKERKQLGKQVKHICELRKVSQNLNDLNDFVQHIDEATADQLEVNFDATAVKLTTIRNAFCVVQNGLTQFLLLLKCAPAKLEENLCVFTPKPESQIHQQSEKFKTIKRISEKLLAKAVASLADMDRHDFEHTTFHSVAFVTSCETNIHELHQLIEELKEEFLIKEELYSVYGKSIFYLDEFLNEVRDEISQPQEEEAEITEVNNLQIDKDLEAAVQTMLLALQSVYKIHSRSTESEIVPATEEKDGEEDEVSEIEERHLTEKIIGKMMEDLKQLNVKQTILKTKKFLELIRSQSYAKCEQQQLITKLLNLRPLLEQYNMLCEYYLIQQLGVHKVSTKMLCVMLTVFIELGSKGFCTPQDLLQDIEESEDSKKGEFGFEDGEGEKDASDKLESEDQLDDAKRPGEEKDKKDDKDCKEEKGVDMSEDFEGKMQDLDKKEADDSSDEDPEDEDDVDKQMGETEDGAEKLDEQIWGDDENKEEEEQQDQEMKEDEENGKGADEDDDKHNDLQSDKHKSNEKEEEGLDAAENNEKPQKQKEKDDIDQINEDEEGDEEQSNKCHNELEEPPQPEEIELDDNVNLDNDGDDENKDQEADNEENPMDIDKMKENMADAEDEEGDKEEGDNKDDKKDDNAESSDSETEADKADEPEKLDENQENPENEPNTEEGAEEEPTQVPDLLNEEEQMDKEGEEKPNEQNQTNHHEAKDKKSKEENVQSMPDTENKGTNDQVQSEKQEEAKIEQDQDIEEQETGEDQEGVGQAENNESKSGHQGVAETKETKSNEKQQRKQQKEKRKQGNTDENRTLGDVDKAEHKQLKTVDKTNTDKRDPEDEGKEDGEEADEYQHVKDAKKSDKTTLDNATEEQSKQIQHKDDEHPEDAEEEGTDQLQETEEQPIEITENVEEMKGEKAEEKSNKPSKQDDPNKERLENSEKMEVDGEDIDTKTVPRGDETTAHTIMDIINDATIAQEPTLAETMEMKRLYESEATSNQMVHTCQSEFETWHHISHKMLPNARELCEQLRLILEPTKCTRMKGDYRTGRRINMKKIIPYIASQFRKDKIWLRRTKPAQRDYKITIAVDNSRSMDHNNSKELTLQAISLISQALSLLESGKLSVLSFGEKPRILLNHTDQFNGSKLVKTLNFLQKQSRIGELLDFVRVGSQEEAASADNGIFENLLIILSDGRNIFSEGESKVRNAVKLARLQRIFIVYIILDNPENKHSILDIRIPSFSTDRKTITMLNYLDTFPFPYYVIVRDLAQLPLVLSDAMRQWFELVSSEQ